MYLAPCVNVHDCVQAALAYASLHLCTRYVNARVRYNTTSAKIEVTYSHSDWFCSDSSVYCANADDKGEWL